MERFSTITPGFASADYALIDNHTNYAASVYTTEQGVFPIVFSELDTGIIIKPKSWTTGRDLQWYPRKARELIIRPGIQYAETACGLGGFLEHVVRELDGEDPKPVAIDSANFDSIAVLVRELKQRERTQFVLDALHTYERRIAVLQNPANVAFYNMTFKDFVQKHPNVLASIDVIVDCAGVVLYQEKKDWRHIPNFDYQMQLDAFARNFRPDTLVLDRTDEDIAEEKAAVMMRQVMNKLFDL